MKKGDLISVSAGEPGNGYYDMNTDIIADHGYLWFIVELRHLDHPSADDADRVMWDCRSLATGHVAPWFEDEMLVAANA